VSYATAAFLSLGGGLILLGTGGVLMGLDGEKTCTGPLEKCPTLYDTGGAGLGAVVAGGVGLLAAVTLFVMEQAARGVGIEEPPTAPDLGGLTILPLSEPGAAGLELRLPLP